MTTAPTKPTTAFWIISVLALLWNLMGVWAYIDHVTMTSETLLSKLPEEQALYTNVPTWVTAAFAIAVWGSTLGSILLLLRKLWATPVFVISFAGIIVQMVHQLFISKSIEVYGPGGAVMPVMIMLIGAFLIWYSRNATAKGWLK
jgi:hypothetical protein